MHIHIAHKHTHTHAHGSFSYPFFRVKQLLLSCQHCYLRRGSVCDGKDTDRLVKVFQVPLNTLDTVFKLRSNTLNLVNVCFAVQKHTPLRVLGLGITQRLTHFTVEGGGEGGRERGDICTKEENLTPEVLTKFEPTQKLIALCTTPLKVQSPHHIQLHTMVPPPPISISVRRHLQLCVEKKSSNKYNFEI